MNSFSIPSVTPSTQHRPNVTPVTPEDGTTSILVVLKKVWRHSGLVRTLALGRVCPSWRLALMVGYRYTFSARVNSKLVKFPACLTACIPVCCMHSSLPISLLASMPITITLRENVLAHNFPIFFSSHPPTSLSEESLCQWLPPRVPHSTIRRLSDVIRWHVALLLLFRRPLQWRRHDVTIPWSRGQTPIRPPHTQTLHHALLPHRSAGESRGRSGRFRSSFKLGRAMNIGYLNGSIWLG